MSEPSSEDDVKVSLNFKIQTCPDCKFTMGVIIELSVIVARIR